MSWQNYNGGRFVLVRIEAASVRMGPFVDEDDGKTLETGLSITQSQIFLSKNDGALANIEASGFSAPTYDSAGYYNVTLGVNDTNSRGNLLIVILATGALPVWCMVEVGPDPAPA